MSKPRKPRVQQYIDEYGDKGGRKILSLIATIAAKAPRKQH